MSFLVRKIERARWDGSDVVGNRIKADVVASCIRPNKSELSVWFAEDQASIAQAKLAMLAAMNKLATVDLVILPVSEVENAGLKIVETLPKVCPELLKHLHRDIQDLDLDSLKIVAQIIQRNISVNNTERMIRSQCKSILTDAIQKNLINASELNPELVTHL